jgi:ankyrin repeat protein
MEAPDAKGTTALLHAVGENCVDGTEHCPVALLLAFGADACHRNDAHVTPLLAAAAKGHVKLFEILVLVLERQGRLDVAVERCTNGDGATVLHFLADRGHAQLLSFVLKRDAFQAVVDAKTKKTGETALVDAARHGRAPCVHALLDGGARPEAAALLAAAQHGHARVVEALLAAGASPAAKDGKGRAAADLCAADATRIASQNKTMLTMLGGMRKSFTSTATHASSADHDACLALLEAARDARHEKHHHAHKKDDHHHAHKKDEHHHVHAQKHH